MELIQKGNAKLKSMYMWNMLTSKEICGRECPNCYSLREQIRFPSVVKARTARYEASKKPNFAIKIIEELNKLRNKPKYFRIHASSEFYSQSYIDSWQTIIEAFPSITFYAYTKRLNDFDFTSISSLSNFVLINSLHFGKLNYGTLEEAPKNSFICPSYQGATCGDSCTYCQTKGLADVRGVWFVKH